MDDLEFPDCPTCGSNAVNPIDEGAEVQEYFHCEDCGRPFRLTEEGVAEAVE